VRRLDRRTTPLGGTVFVRTADAAVALRRTSTEVRGHAAATLTGVCATALRERHRTSAALQ